MPGRDPGEGARQDVNALFRMQPSGVKQDARLGGAAAFIGRHDPGIHGVGEDPDAVTQRWCLRRDRVAHRARRRGDTGRASVKEVLPLRKTVRVDDDAPRPAPEAGRESREPEIVGDQDVRVGQPPDYLRCVCKVLQKIQRDRASLIEPSHAQEAQARIALAVRLAGELAREDADLVAVANELSCEPQPHAGNRPASDRGNRQERPGCDRDAHHCRTKSGRDPQSQIQS